MTNPNSKIQNPNSFILSIASDTTHNHAFRHCFTTTTTKAPPSPLSTSINLTTTSLIIVTINVTTSLPSSTPARIIDHRSNLMKLRSIEKETAKSLLRSI